MFYAEIKNVKKSTRSKRNAAMRAAGINPRDGYMPTEEETFAACKAIQAAWSQGEEYEHRVTKNTEAGLYLSRFTICGTSRNVDDELR